MSKALKLLTLLGVLALYSLNAKGFTSQPYRRVRLFSNAPLQSATPFSTRVNNTFVPPTLSALRRESVQSHVQTVPDMPENAEDDSDYDYDGSEEFEDESSVVPTQTSRPSLLDIDQQQRVVRPTHIQFPANANQNQNVQRVEQLRPLEYSQVRSNFNSEQSPSFTSLFDVPTETESAEWIAEFQAPRRTVQTTTVPPTMSPTTMATTTAATLTLPRGKTMILTPQQFASLFEQEEFKQNLHKYRVVKVAGNIKQEDKSALRAHQAPEITTARSLFNSPEERPYNSYDIQPATKQAVPNPDSISSQGPEVNFYTEAPVRQVERTTEINRPQRPRTDERRIYKDSSILRQTEQITEERRPQKMRTDERRTYADPSPRRQIEPTTENSRLQKLRTDERRFYAEPSPLRKAEQITENNRLQTLRPDEKRFPSEMSSQKQVKQTAEFLRQQNLRINDPRVTHSSVLRQAEETAESRKTQNLRTDERFYTEAPIQLPIEVTKERSKVQLRRPVKQEKDEERSKVQLRRPAKQDNDDDSETPPNSDYQFSTFLDDGLKDSLQERQEVKSGKEVTGMYSYSDGFFRHTVRYRADDTGYHVLSEKHEPIGEGPLEDEEGVAKVHTSMNGQEHSKYTVDGKGLKGTRYASSQS